MSEVELLSIVAADGYRLACRRWQPPEGATPRGLVVYLHGIQSHGGWYEASARHLAGAGFTVYLPDRRGSGLNAADRGHAESWEQLAADVVAVEDRALVEAPGRAPLALVGVSWGGKLAAALAAMHGGRYAALALLCPGICPRRDVACSTKWRIAMALARATAGRGSRFRWAIRTCSPRRRAGWTIWPATSCRYARPRRRFLFQSRRLDQAVAAMTPWIHVPTYLALAGHDRIIDNARSEAWFARLGTQDRTIKRYETAHHTLEFEPEPQPIFADLATWLTARMQGRGSDRAEGWVPRV